MPSVYLDKRLETDNGYGFHIYEPNTVTCLNWLNTQKSDSVVYASYGSAASLSIEQMAQIAEARSTSSRCFLWVVKPTEESKLPSNFREETEDRGIVVSWCPQFEVLAHPAVGCFVTQWLEFNNGGNEFWGASGSNATVSRASLGSGTCAECR